MLKRTIHKIALRTERFAHRLFNRTADGREIDPYIGYATLDQIILRGRVLSKLHRGTPLKTQSRLVNLRDMFGLFLTDEVADVSVRCGDVISRTNEEGYFTLLLPRDTRTGWSVEYVHVDGRADPVPCPVFVPRADARFLVISDVDDTMLETGAYSLVRNLFTSFTGNSATRHIFPDAVELMNTLSDDSANPIFYVSSSPWNMHDFLAAIFVRTNLVRGPMFLRDLGLSETQFITEGHGNHKDASIDQILHANPDLPAVLLGDTGQKDARIYCDAIKRHPGRIIGVGLRTPGPGIDARDHTDLRALEDTKVPIYAANDFTGLHTMLAQTRPDLFSRHAQQRTAI